MSMPLSGRDKPAVPAVVSEILAILAQPFDRSLATRKGV